jgi:hypothetical protein
VGVGVGVCVCVCVCPCLHMLSAPPQASKVVCGLNKDNHPSNTGTCGSVVV